MSRLGFEGRIFSYTNDLERKVTNLMNIYATPDGTLHAMPFNVGQGLWFFDGQIFYRLDTPPKSESKNETL